MAILASVIINRVLDQFRYRDPVLTVNGSISSGAVTATINDFMPAIGPGNIIQINDEYLLVTAVSGSSPMTITVIREWLNSTQPATHAVGDPVYINPRVLGVQVIEFINEALDQMYPQLYDTGVEALTFAGASIGYNLSGAGVDGIVRVDYEHDSASKDWKELKDWEYKDNADTAEFADGKALMVRVSMVNGAKIRAVYRKAFTRISAASDDLIAIAGLQEYMTDLLFYYPMSRLLSIEEIDRSDISGAAAHQRAQDVPAFLALRTSQWYQARYDDLVQTARARLLLEIKSRGASTGYGF